MKRFLLACCVAGTGCGSPAQEASSAETVQRNEAAARRRGEIVQELIVKGLIKSVDCARGKVQVNPSPWMSIDADTKEAFTKLLAGHCNDSHGNLSVTMLDAQSGRDLASFSGSGYSVK